MSAAVVVTTMLADNDTDKGSPIGLFIVLLLVVAVYFLYRSMSRHMRNLPESFDLPPAQTGTTNRHAGTSNRAVIDGEPELNRTELDHPGQL